MLVFSFYAPRPIEEEIKWGCDYDELLKLLDKSCKVFDLQHYVISDEIRPRPLNTFRTELPQNLMQAFLYGQLQVLRTIDEPVLFVGADCVLVQDPRPLSQQDCDLVITLGPFHDCEMNTGAIWCNSPKNCIPVWQRVLDRQPQEWGQDQTFLYAEIQKSAKDGFLNLNKVRCEEHNWAPENVKDDAGMPTVVHFRGPRKSWMKDWTERHLGF